ncbi:GGDEF domain-containing protein [Alkalimonas collagenimarina]|uniref:diguanylate cyclase n=1 Tax=Alkalimonas collagenimarina TaxID=400390 RepID=A0ABT9GZN6_9GAMM|nr:GGDEF domain-containing protein [Alkalimonas collagenimarina]MDP4536140.1 GGDEF domain-containing protein [Alkalimonas collagenimarina]
MSLNQNEVSLHLLVLAPLFLLALASWFYPELALFDALPFPLTAYLVLAFVASLALLMRQTDWLYWLAFLTGHYWVVQAGLQQPLTQPDVAALYFFLPLFSVTYLWLLAILPRPPLWTKAGILLLLITLLAPGLLLLLPLAAWTSSWPDYHQLLLPLSQSSPLMWGQLGYITFISCLWLAVLSYRQFKSHTLAQFAVLLALLLFNIGFMQPDMSGWATIAASTTLLLSLAMHMLQLAYIDELTQLPQRRALLAHLNRLGKKSAVTMLDVDHFKKFNDTYGHDVGDQVLRLLGAILAKQPGMTAYRYGGEEFTLVFHHANPKRLQEQLEQVRQQVADYPLVVRQAERPKDTQQGKQQRGQAGKTKTVQITISLGCAIRLKGEKPELLLKRADQALYKAKKKGRNCVVIAS